MHHHHIQSPLSSKVYVNLILIKKWGQHPREYEYLKVKLRMQKWIIDKTYSIIMLLERIWQYELSYSQEIKYKKIKIQEFFKCQKKFKRNFILNFFLILIYFEKHKILKITFA